MELTPEPSDVALHAGAGAQEEEMDQDSLVRNGDPNMPHMEHETEPVPEPTSEPSDMAF